MSLLMYSPGVLRMTGFHYPNCQKIRQSSKWNPLNKNHLAAIEVTKMFDSGFEMLLGLIPLFNGDESTRETTEP